MSLLNVRAQETIIVSLDKPGTLETTLLQISSNAKYGTSHLTVQGPINGKDMMYIREMCGVSQLNTPTEGVLTSLNLEAAYIMESTEPYISVYGVDYTSHSDEFGPFFLYNCDKLTELTLPGEICVIDTMAFAGCSGLQALDLPGSLLYIGYGAFVNCNQIKSLEVPAHVFELGIGAFQRMESLETLTLGNSITEIENSIVVHDYSLKTINLGRNLKTFNPVVFYNTPSLQQVNVDEVNPYYTSVDGVLYSKELDTLLVYPPSHPDTVFEIPQGVRVLAPYSMYGAQPLQSLTLPPSVEVVDSLALFGCSHLEMVQGGEGLTTIRFGAFGSYPGEESMLSTLSLPPTVSLIEGGAFFCQPFLTVDVDEQNPNYVTDESGLLYTKDFSRLCLVPAYTEQLALPETVKTIGEYAFAGVMALRDISLPDQVENILDGAFTFAMATESICLGNHIKEVGAQVIDYCMSLKDLYLFTDEIADERLHEFALLDESGSVMEQCVLRVLPGRTEHFRQKKGFYSAEYEMSFFADIQEIEHPDGIGRVVPSTHAPGFYRMDGRRQKSPVRGLNIITLPNGVSIKAVVK